VYFSDVRKLYQPDLLLSGDKYSLYFAVARGWTRTLPLHILIGDKYFTTILLLDPLSFFFFVEKESTEAAFAIKDMKFKFRGEVVCPGALRILKGKNETLKKANPTGQLPQALTMRFPDGTPLRTADGKLRKISSHCPSSRSVRIPHAACTPASVCLPIITLHVRGHTR